MEGQIDHDFLDKNADIEDQEEFDETEQVDITIRLFKFIDNNHLISFSENKIWINDQDLKLLGEQKVEFPHYSAGSSCYPAIRLQDVYYGIYLDKIYKFSSTDITPVKELQFQIDSFGYTFFTQQELLIQDPKSFKLYVYNISSDNLSEYTKIKAPKQQCYIFNYKGSIYFIPRFELNLYVLENGKLNKSALSKPGFNTIARSFTDKGLVFDVDNKTYHFSFDDKTFIQINWEKEKQSGWLGFGRWYYENQWEDYNLQPIKDAEVE